MKKNRTAKAPPPATAKFGWRYHHLGIPTSTPRSFERYIADYKMYVSGYETSDYGIEWMRFEEDSPISKIIQQIPHIAFEVADLEEAIKGKTLIGAISSPSPGVHVAMILADGAPIELLEFSD